MTEALDRRVRKTREALHSALASLVVAKGYDAVTIQDVLDAADVGRSTFYSHFAGKEALLRSGFDRLRAELEIADSGESRHVSVSFQRCSIMPRTTPGSTPPFSAMAAGPLPRTRCVSSSALLSSARWIAAGSRKVSAETPPSPF